MKVRTINGFIALFGESEKTETESGILIAGTMNNETIRVGTVAVKSSAWTTDYGTDKKFNVEVGTKVLYNHNLAIPMKVDGVNYLLINCNNIVAVFEE